MDWLAEAQATMERAETNESEAPKSRDHQIEIALRDPDGKMRQAVVTFHIPSVSERRSMVQLRHQLAGGIPWANLAPEDRDLVSAQVTVAAMIQDAPEWLRKLLDVDISGLYQMWRALTEYEWQFFRRDPLPGEKKPDEGGIGRIFSWRFADGRAGGPGDAGAWDQQSTATQPEPIRDPGTIERPKPEPVAEEVDLLKAAGGGGDAG